MFLNFNNKEFISILPTQEKKLVEILEEFSHHSPLVFSDSISAHQDTNKANYPFIMKDFIKDVNKSSEIIHKALTSLCSNENGLKLLEEQNGFTFFGHQYEWDGVDFVNITAKENLKRYASEVKENAKAFYTFLRSPASFSTFSAIRFKKTFKKMLDEAFWLLESIIKEENEFGNREFLPNQLYYHLGELAKEVLRANLDNEDLNTAAKMFRKKDNSSENYVWHFVYLSANLIDEKILPKDTHYNIVNMPGFDFEILLDGGCKATKNMLLYAHYSPNFSIMYYLKKYIIETVSGQNFFFFMCLYKDYLAKDKLALEYKSNPMGYNQDHPHILHVKNQITTTKAIEEIQVEYERILSRLNIAANYFEDINVALNKQQWISGLGVPDKTELLNKEIPTGTDVLNNLNLWVDEKLTDIMQDAWNKETHEGQNHLRIKGFMEWPIKSILDHVYRTDKKSLKPDISGAKQNEQKAIYSIVTARATFHDLLQNSYVLDFRENAPWALNEEAQKLVEKDEMFRNLVEVLRDHPFHDFFEFDKDIFSKDSGVDIEFLLGFFRQSKTLNLPIRYKTGVKLRKVMNYKALGIYFLHSRTMGLDFRNKNMGMPSYVHELAHHIDLTQYSPQRDYIINRLYKYFYNRIDERKEYYLDGAELIARAAEIVKLLIVCKYETLKNTMQGPELISKMRYLYENSLEALYMKSWERYSSRKEYIAFEQMILEGKTKFLDEVYSFFRGFWQSGKITFRQIESTADNLENKITSYRYNALYKKKQFSYEHDYCKRYGFQDLVNEQFTEEDSVEKQVEEASYFKIEKLPDLKTFTQEESDENIKKIKIAWAIYEKYGKEQAFKKIKDEPLYLTQSIEQSIINDFKNKFGEDEDFSKKLNMLKDIFLHVKMENMSRM